MSLPVELDRMTAVPAVFSAAVTPVLEVWSLMAATAADRPAPPEVLKDTLTGLLLSDCRVRE